MKPACANWKIWKAAEIEGHSSLGVQTLFIRSLGTVDPKADLKFLRVRSKCNRLWLCKEFYRPMNKNVWKLVRNLMRIFDETCIEVEPQDVESLPEYVRKKARLYIKVAVEKGLLKDGDHVCIGPAFNDESFELGHGKKVTPDMYDHDIKIA